ncbi:MAG: DUF4382 domain-containing protein [Gammaproteobacteria bacterium]|nr:DUF4382 domain-containing protein [Gammaproteobacteria bacterium]
MARMLRFSAFSAVLVAATFGLADCGGGGGGSPAMTAAPTSQVRLAVADAPLDGATHVVVVFTGVELLPNSGSPVTITFAQPKSIDLMTQGGTASAVLFNQPIPSGTYSQVRLMVNADGSGNNSYVQLADGTMHGLLVPSGAQTGLKLVSGFMVPTSGVVDYTIDFNLRQAITCPPGQGPACILKPVERLVDNTSVGNIQGQITSALPAGCTPGAYLYDGILSRPEDMNSAAPGTDMNQPIASVVPVANSTPPYYYQFTFLPPGTYTVAFTCQAALDNPDQADVSTVTIVPVATPTVSAGQTQSVNIAFGGIQGQVTLPSGCTVPDAGVYLYAGDVTAPEDWNSAAPATDTSQPIASTIWAASAAAPFDYQFAALPPGTYTVAFTCKANMDNLAQGDPSVTFGPIKGGISVAADQFTMVDIP